MTTPMDVTWTWANDTPVWLKPRRTVYFIFRRIHGSAEYLRDKRGRMRTWRSQETVKKALRDFMKKTTPTIQQQYEKAKARHPDMLLLFRMGDFYEMFGEDAEIAAQALGLTVTHRDKSQAMAGFPHDQLEAYLQKLMREGHKVAICEQVED